MLPRPLVERARAARCILEVGAGRVFATSLALHEAAPHAEVWLTDVSPAVLEAPAPLRPLVHDVTRGPEGLPFSSCDLVVAVRLPEELQLSCARLARALGADFAMRPLKDEWADVSSVYRRHVVWSDGWRFFPHP